MTPTPDPFAGLDPVWRTVFDEAWRSAASGSYGVGAALVDPGTGRIVATGRNRVAEPPTEPGLPAGNMLAHAEIGAFAALDRFDATGLHLVTTLEPCLMCAATAMQLKVERVSFAAVDEFFDRLDDVWTRHPLTSSRRPEREGPLAGDATSLAGFARLLPMTFTLGRFPGSTAAHRARERHPRLAAIVDDLISSDGRLAVWRSQSLDAALADVAGRLDG